MINKLIELEKSIGNTKIIKAEKLMKKYNLKSNLYLKIESTNYTGSIKDRLAFYIIKDAIIRGLIDEETIIIEATSGNTGISVAAISDYINLKCIIIMPDSVSLERIEILKQYNAGVVFTPKDKGMKGCIEKQEELKKKYKKVFSLDQFNNPLGIIAHYETTGPEIINDLKNIDFFVCGIGTGTTFTGCSKYLKEYNQNTKCIAVEPLKSNVLNGGKSNDHLIEGLGAGFIPNVLDLSLIDHVIDISCEQAYIYTNVLFNEEKLKCGISSGAVVCAGVKLCQEYTNKNILVILPDDGNRYISKGVFDEGFIKDRK